MSHGVKVGALFVATVLAIVSFISLLGVWQPFGNYHELTVAYNFAGGIEVGSPIRVMGIKVGKVKRIEFDPQFKIKDEEVKLKIHVQIEKKAWSSLRADSQFYINLAGVIGEKYLEISPGTTANAELTPGQAVRGIDPPRIDQMISQGYALAGKMLSLVENNESSVVEMINSLNGLLKNMNKTMEMMDKLTQNKKYEKIINNIMTLTEELVSLSKGAKSEENQKTVALVKRLLWRLDDLDKAAIKKFFQEEGVKARVGL
jgi:phospholipid/cholesterol/gamma-HCH transport system substrate-binding protein